MEVSYSYPATPEAASVDPVADTVTAGPACHEADPPDSVGADGAVRSSRTWAGAVQAEGLARASSERNSTSVVPSAVTAAAAPATGCDHVAPASADVRYSYPAKPEPASVGVPVGCTVADAAFAQAAEPPVRTGSEGPVVSTIAVAAGSGVAGDHAEAFPALSSARNWTKVVPSALTFTLAPAPAAPNDAPPFAELRCW